MSPPISRGAGLRALAGAGLWIVTGCGVIIDEPQYDTRAEQRPGACEGWQQMSGWVQSLDKP